MTLSHDEKSSTRNVKKNKPRRTLKVIGRTFSVLFALSLSLALVGGWIFAIGVSNAETPDRPSKLTDKSSVTIYAVDGTTELATLYPSEGVRKAIPSELIPQVMKNALVSAEDSSFWKNPGFDPVRIAAAAVGHLSGNDDAGGASTITQQYVKNTLVGDEYSLERKWKEVLSATKLSAEWTKDDIITGYLNTVYFGRGATGVENAAQAYFGIPASQLNASQSALLAGVIQSPSVHDPAINEESARIRFDYVVSQMKENGYIPVDQVIDFPETIPSEPRDVSTGIFGENGHVVSLVQQELERQGFTEDQLFTMGADVVTTIDPAIHDSVIRNARGPAEANGVRIASTAIDPDDGSIRGMYGGTDGQGFNYAVEPQMTGSTFKVFTLAAGLEQGIGLNTSISSAPYWADGVELGNSGGMTCGECSLAEATKQSLNTSFYRLQDMLRGGQMDTREMAQRLGVTEPLEDEGGFVAKSITLGSYPTSTVSMSHAFATIANNGVKNDRHIVDHVVTRHGNTVYRADPNPRRVLDVGVTDDIDRALEPIPAHSNGNQLGGGKTGYGKTGTTQLGDTGNNRDAYMGGYTDNLAVSVWVGSDGGEPLVDASGASIWGAGMPTVIWRNILTEVG